MPTRERSSKRRGTPESLSPGSDVDAQRRSNGTKAGLSELKPKSRKVQTPSVSSVSPSSSYSPFSKALRGVTLFFLVAGVVYYKIQRGLPGAAQLPVPPILQTPHLSTSPKLGSQRTDIFGAPFQNPIEDGEIAIRRDAIRNAFKVSWNAYERDAWGFDNYHPIGQTGSNIASQGIGYYIVDVLDSLQLFGLDEEYVRARTWIQDSLTFDVDDRHHAFEVTIRVLGGLLSAYHMSDGDRLYLERAVDLADRILPIFDTPSGIPLSFVNLGSREGIPDKDNWGMSSLAEAGTLQLEFKYLSHLTGNPIYAEKVEHVMRVIDRLDKQDGLAPLFLSPTHGRFEMSVIRLGSRADSYYEYLLKQYLQTNQTEIHYLDMYQEAMNGIARHLMLKSSVDKSAWTSELIPGQDPRTGQAAWRRERKQDHLVCFLGGLLMLGATMGKAYDPASMQNRLDLRDWDMGQELTRTCMTTYTQTATGLAPEIVYFYPHLDAIRQSGDETGRAWYIDKRRMALPGLPKPEPPYDARNMLRPETVESLFIGWRLTHDPIYRQWGWHIFQSFEKHCKVETGGYATIRDVDELPAVHEDRMETFFLSETLKYLFLLYSDDDVLPLSEYVFNTEAHPLPIFVPASRDE